MYSKVNLFYKPENYLHTIQNNNLHRQITGIRYGSNLMPINYLRKFNIKRQYRIWTLCNNGSYLGTEMHLVMECQNAIAVKYRLELLKMITSLTPQFDILNNEQKCMYSSVCVETQIIFYFAIYLEKKSKLLKKKL